MSELKLTEGQRKYLRMIELYGLAEETGRTWLDSVVFGYRSYKDHRAAIKELGTWLPWHDRPENQRNPKIHTEKNE